MMGRTWTALVAVLALTTCANAFSFSPAPSLRVLTAGRVAMPAVSDLRRAPALRRGIHAARMVLSDPADLMAPPQPSGDRPSRHFSGEGESKFRIVLLAGFETFNRELYRRAADRAAEQCPGLEIWVCTER